MTLFSLHNLWVMECPYSEHEEHKPAQETLDTHTIIIILLMGRFLEH